MANKLCYEVIETNFRTREGEIDIVAQDQVNECMVFIEVKTRTNRRFGAGVEQISRTKAQRLQAVAQRYLCEHGLENSNWRIDLLSVEMSRSGSVENIEQITSAIEEQF